VPPRTNLAISVPGIVGSYLIALRKMWPNLAHSYYLPSTCCLTAPDRIYFYPSLGMERKKPHWTNGNILVEESTLIRTTYPSCLFSIYYPRRMNRRKPREHRSFIGGA